MGRTSSTHNVGRASNRADQKRRQQVLELVRENYAGEGHERFGPTLASEHLAADHGLEVPRDIDGQIAFAEKKGDAPGPELTEIDPTYRIGRAGYPLDSGDPKM